MTAIHTALDIRPAYEPRTLAEMIAADKERERKWRTAAQKRPVARVAAIERQPEPKAPEAHVERIWPRQHNAHVRSFLEWKGNEPLGWLKMRCREMDVGYIDIIRKSRMRHLIDPRHRLMAEMKVKFPHLTLSAIGRLFERDHTVIYFAIQKMGLEGTARVPIGYRSEEVRALYERKKSIRAIGRELGYDHNTVANFIRRMGWTR